MIKNSIIKKALGDMEVAWEEMKSIPVHMSVEEFEKGVLRQARKYGVQYSQEKGKWLDMAKKAISNGNLSQEEKNLYLAEANPPELQSADKKFHRAFMQLHTFVEWAYSDMVAFVNNPKKDEHLKAWLRWRVLPVAEAYHKLYKLNLRGEVTKQKYLRLRPVVVLKTK